MEFLKIEDWSLLQQKLFIVAIFVTLCFLEYWFVVRVSLHQLKLKNQSAHELEQQFIKTDRQFTKTIISTNQSTIEKNQLINLHRSIDLMTLLFYLLETAHKNSVHVLLLKPLLQSTNMQIQLILQGSFFQLINDLSGLQNAPWALRILKLKIWANHSQEQLDLIIEVCH